VIYLALTVILALRVIGENWFLELLVGCDLFQGLGEALVGKALVIPSWEMPKIPPRTTAAAATRPGLSSPTWVIGNPSAADVPTVEAKPKTTVGVKLSSSTRPNCTMAALPTPTQMAAVMGAPPRLAVAKRLRLAIPTPVRLDATDCFRPAMPPPAVKNEAQAMKITHTGNGSMVAVR